MIAESDRVTYKFTDQIYIGNADLLREQIDTLFTDTNSAYFVFDLEHVRLCDSYGLRLLLTFQRKADAAGRKLLLYRPDHLLKSMLETTQLTKVFTIVDNLETYNG